LAWVWSIFKAGVGNLVIIELKRGISVLAIINAEIMAQDGRSITKEKHLAPRAGFEL
jgi:hypothetical protein